ncbi:ankyrin repeat-containing domain protein [Ilyonectria destructans]|nr:ankyrin repeat-containing domain protein [Ilyonectria destructans]
MEQNGQEALGWAKHTDEILHLFISQNKTLAQVISHMEEKHNFKASERQYKHRFSNLKNVRANEWIWIDQEIQRRAAVGKKSEPRLLHRPLPADRVRRETARHRRRAHTAIPPNQLPNPSPGRISVRTPPLAAANVLGANLNPLDIHMDNEVESCEPQISIQVSPREAPFDMQFELEQIIQPDAMEIEAEINFFSLNSSGMWDLDGDGEVNWATPNREPPVTMVGDPSSYGTTSSPRPQSSGRRWSPISQFFNFEIFDTRPSFQLMTNLPWFKLQTTLEQLDFTSLQMHPVLDGVLLSPTSVSITLPPETRRSVLLNLLGPISDHQLPENVSVVTNKLQRFIPERCEGELSHKIAHILDSRSTSPSSLSAIFSLAAYFASNNKLQDTRMDTFLKWVIDQKYTEHLERFLQINTPTIHAFATQVLKSAVRVKNIKFLTALMDLGVKFDSILDKILQIGDMDFMKLALSRVSLSCFDGERGVGLFHLFVEGNHFDLARTLATKGVNVDGVRFRRTPLYSAVCRKDVHAVTFLLELGADVNKGSFRYSGGFEVPLVEAVLLKESDIVAVLLEHDANTSCKVGKQNLIEWSSLNCRNIYRILQEHMGAIGVGFTIGDLIDAANEGNDSFKAYLQRHRRTVSKQQLEQALGESIRLGYLAATTALLEHGVSPNCPCLDNPPLRTALQSHKQPRRVCELLIKYKADVNGVDILKNVVRKNDFTLLQIFIKAGVNLEEQGMEALVEAAELGHVSSAAFLLHLGVDVNTPGLEENPLQAAARMGELEMLEFLLAHGADINAPAYLNNGRTALQAALESEAPETAWLLLERGADVSGPPALLVGGATALEAVFHNWNVFPPDQLLGLCNYLLDSNAPVNRPNGEPSSALHGAIERSWDGILARMLEPQRNAIINHMWCDQRMEEDWEPRTPTQLAAANGRLEAVKMLVGRGTDINEAPAYRFGRTALQVATSSDEPDMDLVQFLLDKGADVNAKPAVYGGITALQGAAISGDIMLAKLLIDNGADVNGSPSFVEGRYAIEGAAEHGRLDMVQLLLNAGARGNVFNGMGFKRAIELATKNEHFAIANLLKNITRA